MITTDPREVTSAAIYKTATYVKWPESILGSKDAPLRIAVFGVDPLGGRLDDALRSKKLGTHPFRALRFPGLEDLEECQILFVPVAEEEQMPKLVEHYAGKPVLIVGESIAAAENGAGVALYFENSKLHVAVNPEVLRAVRLELSSELIKLARVVQTRKKVDDR
ncbi:MAG: YfiR family protein [Planctomycetes bacterium]|nr:YfiR family protein [Planctomycetota bacterium]